MCDVLVVDDDPLVRSVIVEALRDDGFEVCEAANLDEARAEYPRQPSHRCLLVDNYLGHPDGSTGFSFRRALVETSLTLRVVYMTGGWSSLANSHRQRERNLGKPFSVQELVAIRRGFVPF